MLLAPFGRDRRRRGERKAMTDLAMRCVIDAPTQRVYAAWTNPELLRQWLAPAMPWPRARRPPVHSLVPIRRSRLLNLPRQLTRLRARAARSTNAL